MTRYYYDLRCYECGRFVKHDADFSVPFGGALASEIPDKRYYCDSCVEKLVRRYRGRGWIPEHWISAKWHVKVKKILDQRR